MNRRMDIYESMLALTEMVEQLEMEEDISVEPTETGMLIQMGDKVLFEKGKAELKPAAFVILNAVGVSIKDKVEEVLIGGHTDNTPINSIKYPSNWELSSARALVVVKYLVQKSNILPEVFGAVGYGEFRPIVENNSPENMQKNRRVEFLVTWK